MNIAQGLFPQFLCVTLVICLSGSLSAGQSIEKCAQIGEYCQSHVDCCSNRCLTYLYRCLNNNQFYPYPFLEVVNIPTVNLDEFIAQNFAKSIDATTNAVPVLNQRFSDPELETDVILPESKLYHQLSTASPEPQAVSHMTLNGVESCKEIGEKCYHNSECCTKRCHGFLHQCVT